MTILNKYYVAVGESKTGPFSIDELKTKNITRDTLVWTEGMADWKRAGDVSELSDLWSSRSDLPPPIAQRARDSRQESSTTTAPPKTWMVESILVTILCCLPFGIAGIVNASQVESRYYAGNIEGAQRASIEAKKWTMIGFWIGVAGVGVYVIWVIIAMVMGMGSAMFWNQP